VGGGSFGNKAGTEPAKDYILLYVDVNDNYCLWKGLPCINLISYAFKLVAFVMGYRAKNKEVACVILLFSI
jgi:hypothetical protein